MAEFFDNLFNANISRECFPNKKCGMKLRKLSNRYRLNILIVDADEIVGESDFPFNPLAWPVVNLNDLRLG